MLGCGNRGLQVWKKQPTLGKHASPPLRPAESAIRSIVDTHEVLTKCGSINSFLEVLQAAGSLNSLFRAILLFFGESQAKNVLTSWNDVTKLPKRHLNKICISLKILLFQRKKVSYFKIPFTFGIQRVKTLLCRRRGRVGSVGIKNW